MMTLSICTDLTATEHEMIPFCKTIMGMANDLMHFGKYSIRNGLPNLDVVFKRNVDDASMASSGISLQSYEGVHDALKIELSLSEQMCCSRHVDCYVVAALQEAIDAADEYFSGQNIVFEKEAYLNLINTVSACHHKKTALN